MYLAVQYHMSGNDIHLDPVLYVVTVYAKATQIIIAVEIASFLSSMFEIAMWTEA